MTRLRVRSGWLLALVGAAGCSVPAVPSLPKSTAQETVSPRAELIVITDNGLRAAAGRQINQLGAIVFLNEANAGPVRVTIHGYLGPPDDDPAEHGRECMLVHGMRLTRDGAVTPAGIPPGGAVSTCVFRPGTYEYVVHVGEKMFEGRFVMAAEDVFRSPGAAEGQMR